MKAFKHKYLILLISILSICYFAVSCDEENDYTSDSSNPTVVSYYPVSGDEDVSLSSNLVLTFNEDIQIGEGNIIISSESGNQTIDVSSDEVVISDDERVVTINPDDFAADEEYTVTIEQSAFADLVGNIYMGMDTVEWTFTSRSEQTSMQVFEFSPEDGSDNASLFNLSMTFTSDVEKGEEGNITIYDYNGDIINELAISDQSISVDGNELDIQLETLLDFATSYYVNVDAGAIVDEDGNEFEGISDSTTWNFTTTEGSSSDLVVYIPFDDDFSDESGNKFDAFVGASATTEPEFVYDDERGKVVLFNSGSYAQLPKHDLLRPSGSQDFSCNLWVKLEGIGSDPVLFANSDWNSGSNPGILLCTDDGDTYTPGGDGTGWIVNLAGSNDDSDRLDWKAKLTDPQAPSISDNEWHMVSIVLDQTNKILHVYVDGTEYVSESTSTYDLSTLSGSLYDETNDYPFTLWEDGTGTYNSGSDTRKELSGYMDDLRIYNKALSADEISSLFNK